MQLVSSVWCTRSSYILYSIAFYANITVNGHFDHHYLFPMHNIQPLTSTLFEILLCSSFPSIYFIISSFRTTFSTALVCLVFVMVFVQSYRRRLHLLPQLLRSNHLQRQYHLVVMLWQHFAYVKFSYSHDATHQMNRRIVHRTQPDVDMMSCFGDLHIPI